MTTLFTSYIYIYIYYIYVITPDIQICAIHKHLHDKAITLNIIWQLFCQMYFKTRE